MSFYFVFSQFPLPFSRLTYVARRTGWLWRRHVAGIVAQPHRLFLLHFNGSLGRLQIWGTVPPDLVKEGDLGTNFCFPQDPFNCSNGRLVSQQQCLWVESYMTHCFSTIRVSEEFFDSRFPSAILLTNLNSSLFLRPCIFSVCKWLDHPSLLLSSFVIPSLQWHNPFVIGYLLRSVGVGWVLRFGSARLFATRDTINPLTLEQCHSRERARACGMCVCADYKGGWLVSSVRAWVCGGYLATINGAAVEHQFASTNGWESFSTAFCSIWFSFFGNSFIFS